MTKQNLLRLMMSHHHRKKKLAKILKKNRTTSSTSRGDHMEKEMESYLSAPDLDVRELLFLLLANMSIRPYLVPKRDKSWRRLFLPQWQRLYRKKWRALRVWLQLCKADR